MVGGFVCRVLSVVGGEECKDLQTLPLSSFTCLDRLTVLASLLAKEHSLCNDISLSTSDGN